MAWWTYTSVPALVALLFLASPAMAACAKVSEGQVLVPSIVPTLPACPSSANGVSCVHVAVLAGQGYRLEASDGSLCVATKGPLCPPDFNIVFVDADDEQVAAHTAVGDQEGIVPTNAAHGIVYMRYGPPGSGFRFSQGC